MLANLLAFLPDTSATSERMDLVRQLQQEVSVLRQEYFVMLYGGSLEATVSGVNSVAPICCVKGHTSWTLSASLAKGGT